MSQVHDILALFFIAKEQTTTTAAADSVTPYAQRSYRPSSSLPAQLFFFGKVAESNLHLDIISSSGTSERKSLASIRSGVNFAVAAAKGGRSIRRRTRWMRDCNNFFIRMDFSLSLSFSISAGRPEQQKKKRCGWREKIGGRFKGGKRAGLLLLLPQTFMFSVRERCL